MTLQAADHATLPRSKRLKASTNTTHDRLDKHIMASDPFANRANYAKFLEVQYMFNRDIDALYADERLQALLPGLADRRSTGLIETDLADLGMGTPQTTELPAIAEDAVNIPEALGWLYVSEGSNLGAALLRKEAAKLGLSDDHGARHLAPGAGGPAAHWRLFTAALDAIELTDEEEERAIAGAKAAFAQVYRYADAAFA